MAKAKSQTFYRVILLVLFVVFMVSLETAAKHDNSIAGGKSKTGIKIASSRFFFLWLLLLFCFCFVFVVIVIWYGIQCSSAGNPPSNAFR